MSTDIAGGGLAARQRLARAPNRGSPSEEMPCIEGEGERKEEKKERGTHGHTKSLDVVPSNSKITTF